MRISVFLFLFTIGSMTVLGQNFNRPVPSFFPEYEFQLYNNDFTNEYLATPLLIPPNNNRYKRSLVIFDSLGYVLWYANKTTSRYTDFKYHPTKKIFTFAEGDYFKVLDSNLVVVDSLKPLNGYTMDSHEFDITFDGNYLISGKSDSIVDLSAHLFSGVRGSDTTHLVGFTIQEFDFNHNLLFDWDSNDHLDPLESYDEIYGYDSAGFDYCHGNSIEKDMDGNYLVSMRHTNSIFKIDRNNGNIIWKLGGKASSFQFINDSGFSGQHDFRRLSNGNVSLFDNANAASNPKITRAIEYRLDTINWAAEKIWDYKYEPAFFARAMGNFQTFGAGYHTIGYGLTYRPSPSFIVIDGKDSLVSELFFKDSVVNYRANSYDLDFKWERPQIECENKDGILKLSAPTGKKSYMWSTGETSQEITITEVGEYQLWVDYGLGMIGSYPIQIDSLSTFCNTTALTEHIIKQEDWIIDKIYDIRGREVDRMKAGAIYIIRYTNGEYRKQMIFSNNLNPR